MKKYAVKKAQMEILGLLIIVILFSLGMLFAVRFIALKEPSAARANYVQAQLATNMLNALLLTDAKECKYTSVASLMADCAGNPAIDCNDNGEVYSGNTADSCNAAKDVAEAVFKETLNKWKVRYNFTAYTDVESPLEWTKGINSGRPCSFTDPGDSEEFPISTRLGQELIVKLHICG